MLNTSNLTNISELFDVIDYFTSNKFKEKWRYKFSNRFITLFQLRIIKSLKDSRPIKYNTLYLYLNKKCGYSRDQIIDFFEEIDVELLRPLLIGTFTK